MKTIEINYRTIERYARKIEKQNLENYQRSLAWGSMLNHIRVLCVHNESDMVEVNEDWKNQFTPFIKTSSL